MDVVRVETKSKVSDTVYILFAITVLLISLDRYSKTRNEYTVHSRQLISSTLGSPKPILVLGVLKRLSVLVYSLLFIRYINIIRLIRSLPYSETNLVLVGKMNVVLRIKSN